MYISAIMAEWLCCLKGCDYIIINGVVWGSTPHVAFCFWLWKSPKSQSPLPHGVRMESTWIRCGLHMDSKWTPGGLLKDSTWSPSGVWADSAQTPPQPVAQCKVLWKRLSNFFSRQTIIILVINFDFLLLFLLQNFLWLFLWPEQHLLWAKSVTNTPTAMCGRVDSLRQGLMLCWVWLIGRQI